MGRPPRRPRLLIMAYACSPYQGSEAGIGWHAAIQAAANCDTWVICEKHKFEREIQRYIDENGAPAGLRFIFLPERSWAAIAWRLPGAGYVSYNLWQRRACRLAARLNSEIRFDLIHHVNIIGFREPGYLWKLGVPFVWGPVGGTQNYPWRFIPEAGVGWGFAEATRNLMNSLQFRFSPRVRKAARASAMVLAANSRGQCDFRRVHGVSARRQLETGVQITGVPLRRGSAGHQLRILWCGSLITRKAATLLLKAVAALPADVPFEVEIIGEGPLEARWRELAARLGLDSKVRFLGAVPYSEALGRYAHADVFVFTSLRDTSGNVILEAMAAGVPVVCLDHHGAGDIVTDECGIKIPVSDPKTVVSELRHAIERLARDPDLRMRLAEGSLRRVEFYSWQSYGANLAAIYEEALSRGGSRQGL